MSVSQSGGFHFEIEGAKELDRLFLQFDRVSARKGLRRAVRDAHRVVFKSIKQHIADLTSAVDDRRGPGLRARMQKAIRLRAKRKNKTGTYAVDAIFVNSEAAGLVSYPRGAHSSLETKKTQGRRTFIPAALEFGHKDRQGKPVAPKPFMGPAVDSSRREAEAALKANLARELDRLVEEHRRK
jgi:hypothetical protein